jgi:small subunit ribosomal protein S6
MRSYELMFVVVPTATDEELDKLIVQLETVVKSSNGEILSVERVGKKKLAYRIGKYDEGIYVLFCVKASGDLIKEFERRLKVTDAVLRYVSVRVDESQKRVEKVKTARLKKARKKSSGVQPDAATPAI